MGSPELRARVEAILADRAARRRRLLEWQQATRPNKMTSDAEWKAFLEPLEYEVLRQKGTEPRGGEYDGIYPAEGYFSCRGCGLPLYSAAAKFKSGCGWPAFDKCYVDAVDIWVDRSLDPVRIEITCAGCGGHLGHVFAGERMTPTNERHCVNSVSILRVNEGASMDHMLEEGVTSMRKLAKILPNVNATADVGEIASRSGLGEVFEKLTLFTAPHSHIVPKSTPKTPDRATGELYGCGYR